VDRERNKRVNIGLVLYATARFFKQRRRYRPTAAKYKIPDEHCMIGDATTPFQARENLPDQGRATRATRDSMKKKG
jgi:hypothetical protein